MNKHYTVVSPADHDLPLHMGPFPALINSLNPGRLRNNYDKLNREVKLYVKYILEHGRRPALTRYLGYMRYQRYQIDHPEAPQYAYELKIGHWMFPDVVQTILFFDPDFFNDYTPRSKNTRQHMSSTSPGNSDADTGSRTEDLIQLGYHD